jgi:hypothetical protein
VKYKPAVERLAGTLMAYEPSAPAKVTVLPVAKAAFPEPLVVFQLSEDVSQFPPVGLVVVPGLGPAQLSMDADCETLANAMAAVRTERILHFMVQNFFIGSLLN